MANSTQPATTHFAPAERAGVEEVQSERATLLSDRLAPVLLEAIPELVMVLNHQRQVLAVNQRFLDTAGLDNEECLLGQRPGEILGCVHAESAPGGCGTDEHCSVCGAVNAILDCQQSQRISVKECRLRRKSDLDGGAVDVEVQATPITVGNSDLVVLAMRDISSEKRRDVLERTFFHDVLNIVSGLRAVSELLSYGDDSEAEEEYRQDLFRMSVQIGDEIMAQRQLLAAERGQLALDVQALSVPEALESVAEVYRHHTVARGRELVIGDCPDAEVETDRVLLQRVLGNLTKNALEATPEGGTVTLAARVVGDTLAFSVANPTVMPQDVKKQIFQRSFSTKGGSGRGIGTHSVKLLTERYLGGKADFTSEAPAGTVFTVTLPRQVPARAEAVTQ
jgi:K+-sensing histidine kinase KdpD